MNNPIVSDSETYSSDDDYSDTEALPTQPMGPTKKWDAFQVHPPEIDSGSEADRVWIRRFEKIMVVMGYIFGFTTIMTATVVAKGTFLFMMSQVSPRDDRIVPFCNADGDIPDRTKIYQVDRDRDSYEDSVETEQVAWIWALFFAYITPEVQSFIRSFRWVLLKSFRKPRWYEFAFVATMECLSAAGMALLVFHGLAQLDSSHALALTHCVCLVPSILLMMSRGIKEKQTGLKMTFDFIAILMQLSGLIVWPLLDFMKDEPKMTHSWTIPLGLLLTSFGWWEVFVDPDSKVPFVRMMFDVRTNMIEKTRYFTFMFVSILKMVTFFLVMLLVVNLNGVIHEPANLFDKFYLSFGSHPYNVSEVQDVLLGGEQDAVDGAFEDRVEAVLYTIAKTPTYVMMVQMFTAYGAYIFSKWACKVQIQGFAFSIPISAVVPTCMTVLLSMCGARANDECAFKHSVPDYLFFECPAVGDYLTYLNDEVMYLWFIWFVSQMWITAHIWFPKSPRLAATEEIFASPMYNGLLVDQSVALNRRADGENDLDYEAIRDEMQQDTMEQFYNKYEKYVDDDEAQVKTRSVPKKWQNIRQSDRITKIYGCATMWHENKDEMIEMLKSLFRIDLDYSARRLSQKYLQVVDPDYYEWETHVLFDDAFELGDNEEDEQIVNQFVKMLVRYIDEAGSLVHCRNIKVKAPKKYPTPYGGRLVWTFPGKTKLIAHLKDKDKIRHKKRWSQCMYMYYLLGFKLMELPIADVRKEAIASNTYLLALDGDIDFQPDAITRLVDLMKKNRSLGAACGRIHPIGSGFMAWYQRFEYAIGHWLQKSTEHVLGCVLCSPGCFSLFRAKALMDDNVMKMYTTKSERPMDYVQYDQGEDRWLCTLLLQRGWRVEYSAASDAFTACPEGFDEFFNQRRRWMPSTIANIFDVLSSYKQVTTVNDDISIFYIIYQGMLMVGTVLGPGTIFLMLVGAFSIAFSISNATSFWLNIVPLALFMIACYTLNSKIQLWIAQIMSAVYALVMMAVMVGIALQIQEDGLLAPTTLMIFLVGGSFILAAIVHPQEFWCLPYGIIYYITIPSMYMLLVIFSIFNMHDVSWGTREVAKKKTKSELDEEKKQEADLKQAAKKKKADGGLLDFIMSKADSAQKGGLDFSLANLCRCMMFTHDDEDDPKKHIVKMVAQMEEVSHRLGRIEHGMGGGGGGMSNNFRRRSSLGRRNTRNSLTLPGRLPEEEDAEDMLAKEAIGLASDSSMSSSDEEEQFAKRDDLVNPYWIEDRDLKNGPVDFLPGVEVQFWKDLIEKYLEPMKADKEKEKKKAQELIVLRNRMVFSFFMINAIFVVVVFLLQMQGDTLYIKWPLGATANVTYVGPKESPVVEVDYTSLQLEPIGLVFVVFFATVLILQIIGMLFHRWGTISQIISTTKLPFCERKAKDMSDEGALNVDAKAIAQELQKPDEEMQTREAKEAAKFNKGAAGRRNTVHNLMKAQQDSKTNDAPINLEKQFRERFMKLDKNELAVSDNAALRRLSTRRGTLTALEDRRASYFDGERRRSTVMFEHDRRMSMGIDQGTNDSMRDSEYGDDYSGSYSGYGGSNNLVAVDSDGSDNGSAPAMSGGRRDSAFQ